MTWPARLTRIDLRRRALAGAGVGEPDLSALAIDDTRAPGAVERAVREAASRGLRGAEVAHAVLRLGEVPVAVQVAPIPEHETPHQRAQRDLVERLASAVARREVCGRTIDQADLREKFAPMVRAACRACGVDDPDAVEVLGRDLWAAAWEAVVRGS